MELLHTVVAALVTLGILITFHEFGHFWVARRCGVRVERFSIGFGPSLIAWRDRQGTEYSLAAIPLGGYVKMLDAREGPVDPADQSAEFSSKPVSRRFAIVAAGPLANFALAIAAFWLMYVLGVSGIAPVVGKVQPDSLAARAGLAPGQEIVAIDGRETPTVAALGGALLERMGESGELLVSVRHDGAGLIYDSRVTLDRWMVGVDAPDPFQALGLELWRPPFPAVIDQVLSDGPAMRAGLKPGDRLLSVDGHALSGWDAWVDYVQARPGQSLRVEVSRAGKTLSLDMVPDRVTGDDGRAIGQVGVMARPPQWPDHMLRTEQYGPVAALLPALRKTWDTSVSTLDSLAKMLAGLISPKNLSGPITIAKVASASAKSGLESYLALLGLLSVSLGVLNLLPIPVLDGGHLLFYAIEWVKGSALSERAQGLGFRIGMALVMSLMALAIYNDLTRL